jgi:hypothetical protein
VRSVLLGCSLAVATAALALAVSQPLAPARAQQAQRPVITVAPSITAAPGSQISIAIAVAPASAIPPRSFVRLKGLPDMSALSDGHAIAPGAWAVALSALPNLKINIPASVIGRSEIAVLLVSLDGDVLAEAKTALDVRPARQAERAPEPRDSTPLPGASMLRAVIPPDAVPGPGASSVPPRAQPTPPDRERAERMLKRGEEMLAEGNVSGARLLYERAAEAGLAQGAMALAATYDAAELAKLHVRGIQADAKEARRWYERARQLGDADADQRLRRLSAQ